MIQLILVKIGPKPPGTYKSIAEAVRAEPEAVLDFLKCKDNKPLFYYKADNNFFASICKYFGINRQDHYENLKEIIKNRFDSFKTKFNVTTEKIIQILNQKPNWDNFCLNLIDELKKIKTPNSVLGTNKIKFLNTQISNLSEIKEELIEILESIQINTGLNTAFDKIGNFLNLIPKKLKAVLSDKTISKEDLINYLKNTKTLKTISYVMKALHVNEFIQFDEYLSQTSNSSHYDPEKFSLEEGGIVFNPEKISKLKDPQKSVILQCPYAKQVPYQPKNPEYDAVREGCPASTEHLKELINFVGDCIKLIPDKDFDKLMQSVN